MASQGRAGPAQRRPVLITRCGSAPVRRGLTQVELAGLAGLSSSYISMIERGRRKLTRRDHVNALAAALRVPPAEISAEHDPRPDEWAPASSARRRAFPPGIDDIAAARHRELAGQFIGYVTGGDTYAAGAWLRRLARDPNVNPWLLLDQLTTPEHAVSGVSVASVRGERDAPGIRRQYRTGAGWMTAR